MLILEIVDSDSCHAMDQRGDGETAFNGYDDDELNLSFLIQSLSD